jgi:hypothetical protein
VKVKRKPADEWSQQPTRTIAHLDGFTSRRVRLSSYGGRADRRVEATGFFRPVLQNRRWYFADPEGHLFLNLGLCSVSPGRSRRNRESLAAKFGTEEVWAGRTTRLLRDYHFNGLGNWSAVDVLRGASEPLIYTVSGSFMGSFGRRHNLTHQRPGHLGYPNDTIPVFHPGFEPFCEEYARTLVTRKSDPFLLGYFFDNELPAPPDLLDKSLALDASNEHLKPGRDAAAAWLRRRKNGETVSASDINAEDREAFREFVFDRYYSLTGGALRKSDPNHLHLGSRLHGGALRSPGVLRAAGRHLDVIAANVYWQWSPDPAMIGMWRSEARRPFLITEFYAKGDDSGFPNSSGAGWIVPTQEDRAMFYQNFCLGMLETGICVGWHWFKYMDNDPEDLTTDPSNRDSNKGIVTIDHRPYTALLERMKPLNEQVYALADYFDR